MSGEEVDFGDNIDQATFEQILEMDEDESDRDFSKSIVFGFFEQAETTFKQMDDALKAKNLETLSQLGHFLKGSSATLGFNKVRDECEKIQHFGHGKDETGDKDMDDDEKCLSMIENCRNRAEAASEQCHRLMLRFYGSGMD